MLHETMPHYFESDAESTLLKGNLIDNWSFFSVSCASLKHSYCIMNLMIFLSIFMGMHFILSAVEIEAKSELLDAGHPYEINSDIELIGAHRGRSNTCLLYTSPSPRDS